MNDQLLLARAGPGDMSGEGETREGVQVTEVEAGMDVGTLADSQWGRSCLRTYVPHPRGPDIEGRWVGQCLLFTRTFLGK